MSRHIAPGCFYNLPSGNKVHPCRLIQKDGTLMWKHALLHQNEFVCIPTDQSHEQHIIKTAQRIEELNSWVSQDLDPWEFLKPLAWYYPKNSVLGDGISLFFKHTCLDTLDVYNTLKKHLNEYETLKINENYLFFKRC